MLGRLSLRGDERALDAGCGSGRVTEALLERLPRGQVLAVDASPSMVAAARERLCAADGPYAGRVELIACDLLDLELAEPADAILSTATFHWIADHERLFARVHAAMRPGAHSSPSAGGGQHRRPARRGPRGALARALCRALRGLAPPWNYAGAEVTEARLLAAGFAEARCWLTPAPAEPDQPREFLRTIVLGPTSSSSRRTCASPSWTR